MLDTNTTDKNMQITSEIQYVTPERARDLRRTANFERQRSIKPKNVARLCKEMEEGRFIPGTQIYLCELPNGEVRIANGNHTLEAVAMSGEPQCLTVTIHKVKNLDEIGEIYAVFDIHAPRNWVDSAKAKGIEDVVAMPSKVLPAIKIIERGFTGQSTASDQRNHVIDTMRDYSRESEIFAGLVKGCQSDSGRLLQRAGVLSVVLETLKYQPSLAAEFWGDISADDGLRSGMPEKALLNWLRSNSASTGGGSAVVKSTMVAASAWNAKFSEREVQILRAVDPAKFQLLGTPHEKGYVQKGLRGDYAETDSAMPASATMEDHSEFDIEAFEEASPKGKKSSSEDIVQLGSVVIYQPQDEDDIKHTQIAKSSLEADLSKGIIPSSSPLAKSMLGRKAGDECFFEAGGKIRALTIEMIENR